MNKDTNTAMTNPTRSRTTRTRRTTDAAVTMQPLPEPAIPSMIPSSPAEEEAILSTPDQEDMNDSDGFSSEGLDEPSSLALYDPWSSVFDRELGLNSTFVFYLRTQWMRSAQVHLMVKMGIRDEDVFFNLTEAELSDKLQFSWVELVSFRAARKRWSDSKKPIPSGLLTMMPRFRGKLERSVSDPHTFITQMENVLVASGYPEVNWPNVVTLAFTAPEDTSFWRTHLTTSQLNVSWGEHRLAFLRHFERYDQKRKSIDELCQVSQKAGESVQTFLDRVADLARKAGRPLDDEMVTYYVKKGLRSSDLKRFISLKEEPGQTWTFDRLCTVTLMGADQLHQTGSSADSSPPTNPSTFCRHCKKPGHTQANCRTYARKLSEAKDRSYPAGGASSSKDGKVRNPCSKCPNADHVFSKCPKNVCDTCKKPGHLNFNCPDATCTVCKVKGHTSLSFDCPKNPKAKISKGTGKYVEESPTGELLDEVDRYMHEKCEGWWLSSMSTEQDEVGIAATSISNITPTTMVEIPVLLNGHRILAAVDTRATNSIIDAVVCNEVGVTDGMTKTSATAHSVFQELPNVELWITPQLTLQCGDRVLNHQFYVADMKDKLIIGMDLFYSLGFGMVGLPTAWPSADGPTQGEPSNSASTMEMDESQAIYDELSRIPEEELFKLVETLKCFLEENERIGEDEFCTHPEAELPIPLEDPTPIFRPQFDIPYRLRDVVDEQIRKWLLNKKIEIGSPLSRWNSSLLLAPKRDLYGNRTEWRVCFDGRAINERIKPDTYGIPRIKELFRRVAGFEYSSALDLVAAFHQMPIKEEDKQITTFTWGSTKYQFTAAPFGMTHIPGRFQRLMNTLLCEHLEYVLIYIDDIFIFSKTLDEHIVHCSAVIKTLTKHNLRVREAKCHFGYREAALLGHIIDGKSIRS